MAIEPNLFVSANNRKDDKEDEECIIWNMITRMKKMVL
jgi:hypothetical protein